jgi:hypothetical protein
MVTSVPELRAHLRRNPKAELAMMFVVRPQGSRTSAALGVITW